jgi:hypothetical protein
MIATVKTRRSPKPCIVFRTAKTGFVTVETQTYCGETVPAADGVTQLPDEIECCTDCETAVKQAIEALKAVAST